MLAGDMAAWGATEAEITAWRGMSPPAVFEVMPDNVPALEVFLHLDTQWRVGPTGMPIGLDYGAVETVLRLMETEDGRSVFEDIRIMERAALDVFWEKNQ